MKLKLQLLVLAMVTGVSVLSARAFSASATNGLVIHAAELGVGKFHRMDNKIHGYSETNEWFHSILPVGIAEQTPIVLPNKDGSITIFFSNLDELLTTIEKTAAASKQKVQIININGHGMPGGMWYPKDQKEQDSWACADWRSSAEGSDQVNYDGYYSAISKSDIMQMRQIGQTGGSFPCVTGAKAWREIVGRHKKLKAVLADDLKFHFLSCVVGLGPYGDAFTKVIVELLAPTEQAEVISSVNYGLGDWSMPEGMGFWDYLSDAQLDHDNQIYPIDRNDREQMQKGTIRIAVMSPKGALSHLITQLDFMKLGMVQDPGVPALTEVFDAPSLELMLTPEVKTVRIPGTNAYVTRQ